MAKTPNDRLPVLVTGIGGGGHGEQILKALRLGRLDYAIIGSDTSHDCANRPGVDHFEVLPHARHANYLDALIALGHRHGVRAIFHGSEPEMMVMSGSRERLEREGFYVPVNPPSVMNICQNKANTVHHLKSHGFAVPAYREVRALEDLDEFDVLPAVLKPSVGGGGSANVFIAQTPGELAMFTRYLLQVYDQIVVQEYIGSPEEEYTAGVLFGSDGELINSIVIKRVINNALTTHTRVVNRSNRRDLGERLVISSGISQGHVADWPAVRAQCERIAQSLEPRAPVNIQCRVVGAQVIPFEINPRFSGTTSLRAIVGYNEPDVLIRRDVLGEAVTPHFQYEHGLILRSLKESLVGDPGSTSDPKAAGL